MSGRPGNRESKWRTVRRCLAMLHRLQRGPADRDALMRAVREMVPDAYGPANPDARRKRFERDLWNLRHKLAAEVEWDPDQGVYRLVDNGPWGGLELSEEALRGLAFLFETFGPESGAAEVVRPLLEALLWALPGDQQRRVERQSAELRLDLRRLDEGEIDPVVWDKVRRAVTMRRMLRFRYLSPRHERPEPRIHTVEPYELRFRGHYELRAYCRHWSNPLGQEKMHAGWFRYRLDHMLAEGLVILPDRLPPGQRYRRLETVRYRLAPQLARGGVSRHFDEMTVSAPDAEGWVEVTGKTDDLFEARRVLLAYGENCQVLAPPSLVRGMERAAQGLADLYEICG